MDIMYSGTKFDDNGKIVNKLITCIRRNCKGKDLKEARANAYKATEDRFRYGI